MSLLIAAAIRAELEPLAEELKAEPTDYGWRSGLLRLAPLGIGPLEAALSLERLLHHEAFGAVLFTGSAGIYPGAGFAVGDLAQADWATLYDGAASLGRAHFALLQGRGRFEAAPWDLGLNSAGVASGLAVTKDAELGGLIAQQSGAGLENLELYGLALCAERHNLPWGAVLGLTNNVAQGGQTAWKENHQQAAQSACSHVADWLKKGGAELSKR